VLGAPDSGFWAINAVDKTIPLTSNPNFFIVFYVFDLNESSAISSSAIKNMLGVTKTECCSKPPGHKATHPYLAFALFCSVLFAQICSPFG
jgi:hypothetical protein